MNLTEAKQIIVSELENQTGLVAIDGPAGVGKTTLAKVIKDQLDTGIQKVTVIPLDYYATWQNPVNWQAKVLEEIVIPYRRGSNFKITKNIWENQQVIAQEIIELPWSPLIIIEGFASAGKKLIPDLVKKYFVTTADLDEARERAIVRDGEESRERHLNWQQFTKSWFTVDKTKHRCTVLEVN